VPSKRIGKLCIVRLSAMLRFATKFARSTAAASLAATVPMAAWPSASAPKPVMCANISGVPIPDNLIEMTKDQLAPLGGTCTVGTVFGACTGFAFKKAGKAAALGVGTIYAFLQTLAYFDYIRLNWDKIQKDSMFMLDQNKDGKLDEKDMSVAVGKALSVLEAKSTFVAGSFSAGFAYGLYRG